jgi:hypothetical protein
MIVVKGYVFGVSEVSAQAEHRLVERSNFFHWQPGTKE